MKGGPLMELDPYPTSEGGCEKAMRFSERPDADWVSKEKRNWIAPMQVRTADRVLMACDNGRSEPVKAHCGFDLQLAFDDMDAARRIFDALSSDGETGIPWMGQCD
ncbi:MAG: hypothetical protein AAF982_09390 [Pseudomonadota bacterium]